MKPLIAILLAGALLASPRPAEARSPHGKARAVRPAAKPGAPAAVPKSRPGHVPDAYFVLQKEVNQALQNRDLEKAEQACRAQMLLRPDRALPYYDLATVEALRGHGDPAIESLTRAIDRGFAFPDLMQGDPDLAKLHDHPLWQKLVDQATAKRQQLPQVAAAAPTKTATSP